MIPVLISRRAAGVPSDRDKDAAELNEAEVVGGVALIADHETAEVAQPREEPLYSIAPSRVVFARDHRTTALRTPEAGTAFGGDAQRNPATAQPCAQPDVIKPAIRDELRRSLRGASAWAHDANAGQRLLCQARLSLLSAGQQLCYPVSTIRHEKGANSSQRARERLALFCGQRSSHESRRAEAASFSMGQWM
jgi:hypothetical protein